ncbi:AAA domain-containing protein [Saccharopolyspora spinosa]|uniref:Superfamily I DNA and/or RNA helicase n=2 Tax=Saccharopolyspora spinosa TaxID=60894 RepID=A0A2N3Y3X0_SACSN|nr:AAA domain-containing protein [Saccharopolyspora spinosa]PKW17613.1 superfamily I DNA and/or RNA helicase [Saccharopolyspora spinosa]
MSADMDEHRLQLVRAKADQWAKSLIELSSRNTLLNFKNTKTTSLDLTKADSAAVRNLLHGKAVKLSALFEEPEAQKDARTRARNVRRAMRTLAEEQGIDVGKLAQGLIRAAPNNGTASAIGRLCAPLLLRTLRINARTVADSEFELELVDDAELNPVLLYALDKDFGLDLDVAEFTARAADLLLDTDDPLTQPEAVHAELAALAKAQGVSVELEQAVVCGLFNYEKQPMVEDLHGAGDLLAGHDLVAALAGHEPSKQAVSDRSQHFSAPAADTIKPADEFLVQDADSSQQEAVGGALAGHDVLVEGPPGTGKSQTIANIIAGAAARGMRVLFVSEKRAAIEAVTTRLAQVGLDGLVFDLHQQKMDKKHVARQLLDSLESAGRQPRPEVGDTHRKVERRRAQLRRYSDELHLLREPWGKSAYEVQAELLELRAPATPLNFRGSVLRALDRETVEKLEGELREFVDLNGPRVVRRETPWWQAEIWEDEDIRKVLYELDELASNTLHRGRKSMVRVLHKTGLRTPQNLAGWDEVLRLLDEVNTSVREFGGDVFGNRLDDWYHATGPVKEHLVGSQPNSWLTRRRLRAEVKQVSTDGITQRRVLHTKLAKVIEQRDRWQRLGDPHGRPSEVVGLAETMELFQTLRNQLTSVAMCAKLSDVDNRPTEQVDDEIQQLRQDKDMLWKMQRINHLIADFERLGLTPLVQQISEQRLDGEQAWLLFRHVWLKSLLDQFKLDSAMLREFAPDNQTRLARDYREDDTGHHDTAADRVRYEVARRLRQVRDEHPEETRLLREQANKRSRHLPLRSLVEKAPHVLLALRPCWAMSPLVVSRTLPAEKLFDLVVFDEASQIRPHDAVATIARGERLVVAGDDKQLPPSNQFERILEGAEDDDNALQDYESILSTMRSLLSNQVRLRWHYRSTDERLIAFSNQEIYHSDLVTFPGTAMEPPVVLHLVEDGTVAPGQRGSSPAEVQAAVDLVLAHAEQRPDESLGVIAMGNTHAEKVEAAVRRAVQDRPDLQEFFAEDSGPGRRFFVKNLERVQGDERDAIILTLGVAKRSGGRLDGRSFGPLNSEGGRRRLNVAVTRAKRRMTIVSAVGPTEIEPTQEATGTELLRRYLAFTQAQGDLDRVGHRKPVRLNGFEQNVHDALVERGIDVHPQWGVSGYSIDFALAHRDRPGQMVLAVEADGDRYHRMTSVRDRDRLRQSHLERLGWRFHRLWASAWFADRAGEADKIVKAWEGAMRAADRVGSMSEPSRRAAPDPQPSPESRRGPRPDVRPGLKTDEYTEADLIGICRWLLRDGLQLDREERLSQALRELGFKRRGRKIVERLSRAVDIAQNQADKEDG